MDETPETSESLIARVKDLADGEAWTEFLAMYRPVVVRLSEDAIDMNQRVARFTKAEDVSVRR